MTPRQMSSGAMPSNSQVVLASPANVVPSLDRLRERRELGAGALESGQQGVALGAQRLDLGHEALHLGR